MTDSFNPAIIGFTLLIGILLYTINLVRTGKLSAHLAVAWIATELVLLLILGLSSLRLFTRSLLGDEAAATSLFLFTIIWVIFLMLESLTKISSLTDRLKAVSQEHALLKERVERLEQASHSLEQD